MFDLPKRLQTVAKNVEALGPASTSAYLLQAATELNAHRDRITHQDAVIAGLVEAMEEATLRAFDYYRARNGRLCSIEGDDGEKCWIIPFDAFEDLRAALAKAKESRDVR